MGRSKNKLQLWESARLNELTYSKNFQMLLSLALNRFRWVNLPDTCDERFLETQLHRTGMATICHNRNFPDIWQSLIASPNGTFDVYGYPLRWRATGWGDATDYEVTQETGEICYYSRSRMNPWNAIDIFAQKLTRYDRTEDINLNHQRKPFIMVAPQSQVQQLENLLKQVAGFEEYVLGDKGLANMASDVTKIDTDVPLITEDLARSKLNVFSEALTFLGIPRLAFEKGERMIEEEVKATTAPTDLMLMDCLSARRDFCKKLNNRFGLGIEVYFNQDWESYNFNYANNIEAMAQDGLIEGGTDGTEL